MNRFISPMLATLVAKPFHRPGWVNEEKYDGIRALAIRSGKDVRLSSRNQQDLTPEFPGLVRALTALPGGEFILDGEIVVFDSRAVSRFQLLQQRAFAKNVNPVFAVFDCLELNGRTLLDSPLHERRRAVERLLAGAPACLIPARRLSDDGCQAFRQARQKGWEGIIAKDDASIYEPGRRSKSWLKVKCRRESEFVIGGWTPPQGHRLHFGALLVGLFDGPKLRYTGKVGTGYSEETLAALAAKMEPLRAAESPFQPPPPIKAAVWLRPSLVAQIAFAEWTQDAKLRQPAFLGLRDDKDAAECQWRDRE